MEKNEPTQSKYDAALAKYNTQLDDAEIAAQAARIIAEKVPANNTPEVKKFLFNCIDLTTLDVYKRQTYNGSFPAFIEPMPRMRMAGAEPAWPELFVSCKPATYRSTRFQSWSSE